MSESNKITNLNFLVYRVNFVAHIPGYEMKRDTCKLQVTGYTRKSGKSLSDVTFHRENEVKRQQGCTY
jgi:hypothetical protein